MSEETLNNFFLGTWFSAISSFLPFVVVMVSIYLTSRLKSVWVRIISALIFFVSTSLFLFILQWAWLLRNGIGVETPEWAEKAVSDPIVSLIQITLPIFVFCAFIFSIGLVWCLISYYRQGNLPNKVR
jgi:hypothetical protein